MDGKLLSAIEAKVKYEGAETFRAIVRARYIEMECEDDSLCSQAEKIAQTLQELSKGNGQEARDALQTKEDLGISR